MWIRSQDKETLVKVEYIDIDNGLEIGVMTQRGIYDIVGTFKSKKRALEVLDEIQKHVVGKLLIPNTALKARKLDYIKEGLIMPQRMLSAKEEFIEQLPLVYQMPKE